MIRPTEADRKTGATPVCSGGGVTTLAPGIFVGE